MRNYLLLFFIILLGKQAGSQENGCGFRVSKNSKRQMREAFATADTSVLSMEAWPVLQIPVIFHMLFNSEQENISDSLILQELKQLNLDFTGRNNDLNRLPSQYLSIIGTANISFVLADSILPAMVTKGIIRKRTARSTYTFGDPVFFDDPLWNTSKYMNVYIGNIRNGRTSGYVNSFPWRNKKQDAIALNFDEVGHSTRLLTHETGHWFGLWHINEGKCGTENDEISDTPPQKRLTAGCPSGKKECGELSLIQNYMDYSSCRVMFTIGQVNRMRKSIQNFRPAIGIQE